VPAAQRLGDRLQPVVPTFATATFEAQCLQRQVELVVYHQEPVDRQLVELHEGTDRPSSDVHVRARFGEDHPRTGESAGTHPQPAIQHGGAGLVGGELPGHIPSQHIEDHLAHVVPVAGIGGAGVAQPHHQPWRRGRARRAHSSSADSSAAWVSSASSPSSSSGVSSPRGMEMVATAYSSSVSISMPLGTLSSLTRSTSPSSRPSMDPSTNSGILVATAFNATFCRSRVWIVPGADSPVSCTATSTTTFSPRRTRMKSMCSRVRCTGCTWMSLASASSSLPSISSVSRALTLSFSARNVSWLGRLRCTGSVPCP